MAPALTDMPSNFEIALLIWFINIEILATPCAICWKSRSAKIFIALAKIFIASAITIITPADFRVPLVSILLVIAANCLKPKVRASNAATIPARPIPNWIGSISPRVFMLAARIPTAAAIATNCPTLTDFVRFCKDSAIVSIDSWKGFTKSSNNEEAFFLLKNLRNVVPIFCKIATMSAFFKAAPIAPITAMSFTKLFELSSDSDVSFLTPLTKSIIASFASLRTPTTFSRIDVAICPALLINPEKTSINASMALENMFIFVAPLSSSTR